MAPESELPFTIQNLLELNELEFKARGETREDVVRSLRARLNRLRLNRGENWRKNG